MNEILIVSVVVLVFILMYIRSFIEKKIDRQLEGFKSLSEVLIETLDSNSTDIKGSYKQFRDDYLLHAKKLDIYINSNNKLIALINDMDNSLSSKKDKKKAIKENSDKIFSKLEEDMNNLLNK